MATTIFDLPSLFQVSTAAVIKDLNSYEDCLYEMPDSIKQAVLHLMSKRGYLTDENLLKVIFSRLRSLDLSISKVTDKSLLQLPRMLYLCKVDLNSFKEPNEKVTAAGIIALSRACPNLQIVYLRRNINMTDDAVLEVSKNCPLLREFNVGGCFMLTDASLVALGENSVHLKSLNISVTQVTDEGIQHLCSGPCSKVLTEIDVSCCTLLTDDAVESLIMMCPLIKILLFSRCPKITELSRIALEEKFSSEGAKMKQVSWTIY